MVFVVAGCGVVFVVAGYGVVFVVAGCGVVFVVAGCGVASCGMCCIPFILNPQHSGKCFGFTVTLKVALLQYGVCNFFM